MPEVRLDAEPGTFAPDGALSRIHGVLRALASTATLHDVLRVIVGRGAHELHPVGAVIGCQVDKMLVDVARWGAPLGIARGDFDIDLSDARDPCTDAIGLCEPVWVYSAEELAKRYPDLEIAPEVESLAALPLVAHGTALGAVVIGFAAPNRFNAQQHALLVLLADLCALLLTHPARSVKPTAAAAAPAVAPAAANGAGAGNGRPVALLPRLTAREQQIATALVEGRRSSAVARDLGISIYTVRKHISAILRKYDVTSQSELIARIYRQSIPIESETA
jgi:DNA-binding CsgD family transcriptional regulator